jgi:hypothetical protein
MGNDTRPAAPSAAGFFVSRQQLSMRRDVMSMSRDRANDGRSM